MATVKVSTFMGNSYEVSVGDDYTVPQFNHDGWIFIKDEDDNYALAVHGKNVEAIRIARSNAAA